jgi:hypothetical protein
VLKFPGKFRAYPQDYAANKTGHNLNIYRVRWPLSSESHEATNFCNNNAVTDKVQRKCQFQIPGWNRVIHRQVLQDFRDTSQVSLRKIYKNNFPALKQFLPTVGRWQLRSTL